MVLENATTSSDAGFTANEVPASDVDRYSSQSDSIKEDTVEAQPPPHQILIPWRQIDMGAVPFRTSAQVHGITAKLIRGRCNAAAKILNRPLRQDEAEAFATATARGARMGLWGRPIGLAIGSLAFLRTVKTYSFPGGWVPGKHEKSRFSIDKFGPLRGAGARIIWQSLRGAAHLGAWTFGCQVFLAEYGLLILTVGVASDSRLKEYNQALRVKAAGAGANAPVTEQAVSGTTQAETFEQRRQRMNAQGRSQEARRSPRRQSTNNDASPTGGSFQSDYSNDGGQSELMDDAQLARREQQVWPSKANDGERATSSRPQPNTQARDTTFDAMPTSPVTQQNTQPRDTVDGMIAGTGPSGKSSGSAWDRLRQQALDEKSTTKPSQRDA